MNYKLASDRERAARKRARRQREHARLNAKRSKERTARKREEVRSRLTLEGAVAARAEPLPPNPPLLLANTREARKEVRRLHDAASFSRWRKSTMPVEEILIL